ncbi:hypothetical protein GALMADRAFT_773698 [Galerina marginata CBS 339.88]|uniref:Uncharacterized protein n=1 Tax=Galerina marginata (strain CBS 339.88) TaxID=685588 RepID=A0A067SZ46_GALM3|nr:hypothetical protein GALMADRAFT_773698 [Galerina marginata CBS 339.88]
MEGCWNPGVTRRSLAAIRNFESIFRRFREVNTQRTRTWNSSLDLTMIGGVEFVRCGRARAGKRIHEMPKKQGLVYGTEVTCECYSCVDVDTATSRTCPSYFPKRLRWLESRREGVSETVTKAYETTSLILRYSGGRWRRQICWARHDGQKQRVMMIGWLMIGLYST